MKLVNLNEVRNIGIMADIDAGKRGDNLVHIWKLKFGHEFKFCPDFEHKVWSRF